MRKNSRRRLSPPNIVGLLALSVWASALLIQVYPPSAAAQAKPKLTVGQGLSLLAALRTLDGHQVVIRQNGQEAVVLVPWELASGSLRLRVASNISILAINEKVAEDARQAILREGKDTAQAQYAEALEQPAQGGDDLSRIKASELRLDKNEMSVTALSALAPILDVDVPLR